MVRATQPPVHPGLGHRLAAWCGRLRLPRARWVYVLAAIALLAASQLLWLWHSWPVREILDTERQVAGTML